jgi:hypothetical protein
MYYSLAAFCASDYSFNQQQKDFIKKQFIYGSKLRSKLASGQITQKYYDDNIWLASQSLDSPSAAFRQEFINAVESQDLEWLANTIGVSVSEVARFVGQTAGSVVGGVAAGVSSGLGFPGWIAVLGIGAIAFWAFTKGPLSTLKIGKIGL